MLDLNSLKNLSLTKKICLVLFIIFLVSLGYCLINRKNLVIYHKKFNKVYYYPVSNSYFADVLDKKKFKNLINKGQVIFKTGKFQIKYFDNSKGEIILLFDENFDLEGWVVKDLSGNYTEFKINSIEENLNLDKKIFFIPETN